MFKSNYEMAIERAEEMVAELRADGERLTLTDVEFEQMCEDLEGCERMRYWLQRLCDDADALTWAGREYEAERVDDLCEKLTALIRLTPKCPWIGSLRLTIREAAMFDLEDGDEMPEFPVVRVNGVLYQIDMGRGYGMERPPRSNKKMWCPVFIWAPVVAPWYGAAPAHVAAECEEEYEVMLMVERAEAAAGMSREA